MLIKHVHQLLFVSCRYRCYLQYRFYIGQVEKLNLFSVQSPPPVYSSLGSAERLELARQQLAAARSSLATLRAMRHSLGEKYADTLADTMTSCVTQ